MDSTVPFIYEDKAAKAYEKCIYRAQYDIPIKDWVLTIAEGEHICTIMGNNVWAVLDAKAHYNLITHEN
jgi:hypothetical protein